MGLFDRFTGNKADAGEPVEEEPSTSGGSVAAAHHAEEVLHNESTHADALSGKPSGGALYNPYDGLYAAVESRMARGEGPVGIRLPSDLEYVFAEEASVQKRSWSENLCYYTGTGYLAGALTGGARGGLAAIRPGPDTGAHDTARLRVNRLLNLSGRSGRVAGNSLGVLGLFFAGLESGLDYAVDGQLPDGLVTVLAGASTGALFRSSRGPRTAAVAGALGAVGASALVVARNTISKGL